MTSKLIILALSSIVLAAPVSAKGTDDNVKSEKSASAVDTKKYCIQFDNVVGSRVARTQCMTKDEWAKHHVDVDKMLEQ